MKKLSRREFLKSASVGLAGVTLGISAIPYLAQMGGGGGGGMGGGGTTVIGHEGGGLLDKPYPMSLILLSPGERLDVLVKANQTAKNYRPLSLPYGRQGNMSGQQVTLMTVSYKGSRANDAIPSVINAAAKRLNVTPAKTERLALSMDQKKGYINGLSFSEAGYYTLHSRLGTHEVWEVVNQSGMDHPFHQHVNACQVLSKTGGDAAYASFLTKAPALNDTVIVPKWGSAKLLVPVMDYAGMAMFHCHIIEHEDIGMMGSGISWMVKCRRKCCADFRKKADGHSGLPLIMCHSRGFNRESGVSKSAIYCALLGMTGFLPRYVKSVDIEKKRGGLTGRPVVFV